MIPLFKRYPALQAALPYAPIAQLPTPVRTADELVAGTGVASLHIKCDGESGVIYGGNKVRKLAFILARARALGATSTITFGAVGSNHALATAIYARELGLQPVSMLVPQSNTHGVRKNLLRGHAAGATLKHFLSRRAVSQDTAAQVVAAHRAGHPRPFIIPAGGSSPLGTLGFVNAGLELADQIGAGHVPKPDRLYVASGTMGTCVGLLIGFQLAGLHTQIQAVRVTAAPFTSLEKARILFRRTIGMLRKQDASIPDIHFPEPQFALRDEFLGPHYARFTDEGVAAVRRGSEAGVRLEGTYTGKAMACLLQDADTGRLAGQHVLFWNTYNALPQDDFVAGRDYHQLPAPFHVYYEKAVQELDR